MIWSTYVNIRKRRDERQAKGADRLEPKGKWSGYGSLTWPYVNVAPPAYRIGPKSSVKVIRAKRGNLVYPPEQSGRLTVRHAVGYAGEDHGESECYPVMGEIRVETLSDSKEGRLPGGA